MSLFDPVPHDQSIYYLSQIFGTVGTILPIQSNPNMLLATLFGVINTSALVLGTLMVVYVTVIGVLATAHEGEFMGKKWSGLWVPIRMVLGIVALFPTATGYSALQIVIMYIIVQGVGAADKVWNTTLQYVSTMGSPFGSNNPGPGAASATLTANLPTLFQSLVCQATARGKYTNKFDDPTDSTIKKNYYYCAGNSEVFCTRPDTDMLNVVDGPQVTKPNPTPQSVLNSNNDPNFSCPANAPGGGHYTPVTSPTSPIITGCYADSSVKYSIGPGGSCGSLSYPDCSQTCNKLYGGDQTSLQCLSCQAQPAALQGIVSTYGAIAQKVADTDNQYMTWYDTTPTYVSSQLNPKPPEWLQNYCSANSIQPTDCCVSKLIAGGTITVLGVQVPQPPQTIDCAGNSLFINNKYVIKPVQDPTNTTKPALQTVYETYSILPYLASVTDIYTAAVNQWVNIVILGPQLTSIRTSTASLQGWLANAQDSGWILAGGYYYSLAQYKATVSLPTVSIQFSTNGMPSPDNTMSNYRNNFTRAGDLFTDLKNGGGAASNSPGMSEVSGAYGEVHAAMLKGIKNALTDDGSDPIGRIATFGQQLMQAAEISWGILAVAIPTIVGVTSITFIGLGTGMPVNPVGEAMKAFFNFFTPFALLLLSAMFSLGGLLGIYVPLIPYIIFTMGAIGWFIATIEAMVAAPFIALGILSPSGQHELLGKSEASINLLFNLFLRPSLMVFGMVAAMGLVTVAIKLVNAAFLDVVAQVMGIGGQMSSHNVGPFEQIIWIAAYSSLIMTVINKCFSLISYIPERILTWIGGQAVQYGESEALGEVKRGTEAAGGAAGGAAKEGTGSGVKAAEGAAAGSAKWRKASGKGDQARTAAPAPSGTAKKDEKK